MITDHCKVCMGAMLGTRAAEHSNECRVRITKLILEDSCDAARDSEGEARLPRGNCLMVGFCGHGIRRIEHVSDVTVAAAVRRQWR